MGLKGNVLQIDAQRARWTGYRRSQGMVIDAADGFALGGLAQYAEKPDLRLIFLPSDPLAEAVQLDEDTFAWLRQTRTSPYGGRYPSWGTRLRSTSSALVRYDQYRDPGGWTKYVALHRHGGIELGMSSLIHEIRGMDGPQRVVALRSIVGAAWTAAAMQKEVAEKWQVEMPFEFSVGIRNTGNAALGDLAEGWANPGQGFDDPPVCIEDHLLFRREIDAEIDPEHYALDLGDRIDQAFGSVVRRHLVRDGEYAGQFRPRL